MRFQLERWTSSVGTLLLVTDETGNLRGLEFQENESRLTQLLRRYYPAHILEEGSAPTEIKRALSNYFAGDTHALSQIPIAMPGTPFQQSVWTALRSIPAGTTTTYGKLAANIGRKGAGRAVGAANGANPIPIVVPCHRVIGADGSLTGFASGLDRKQWLLTHEHRHTTAAHA
jgi:methylated-DNA-[protein]-cysteine S-methyltransferase